MTSASFLKSIELSSPAKLNLFLDVLAKRPDGYHDIETLFERVSLCDSLRLTEISSDEIVLASESRDIPANEQNIAYQAAYLIKDSLGIRKGVKIEIEKKIPVGAGLGGGSSNAASVLMGLNRLWGLRLSKQTLISYANRLGSDVAFFILNRKFALGRGRGGDLEAVRVPRDTTLWHLLFVPPLKVMTRDVYGLLDLEKRGQKKAKSLKLTKKSYDVNILLSLLQRGSISSLNQNIYNRLSETVIKSYSLVSELKTDLLKSGLRHVHMSGSGPTLFTIFKSKSEAERVRNTLAARLSDRCRIFLASTL